MVLKMGSYTPQLLLIYSGYLESKFKLSEIIALMSCYTEFPWQPFRINNNLRCYDLAMELSNSTIEVLPQNYAEQVNFEDTCKGFLEVAKEAAHQTKGLLGGLLKLT
ncbi:hypothetical protein KIW84_013564 [Lathyrus oleraceus]|uniref:Uncharacterized protein n=1 Tax=Pisum sativum TaxID=3888 RepID=A0A9D5BKQ6_PEA|nr:hypothetical protein KIW84_013561 [Pisum sativum]KAI5445375.1 hypothetical protein KIW84_013564 [Pisum sativum]